MNALKWAIENGSFESIWLGNRKAEAASERRSGGRLFIFNGETRHAAPVAPHRIAMRCASRHRRKYTLHNSALSSAQLAGWDNGKLCNVCWRSVPSSVILLDNKIGTQHRKDKFIGNDSPTIGAMQSYLWIVSCTMLEWIRPGYPYSLDFIGNDILSFIQVELRIKSQTFSILYTFMSGWIQKEGYWERKMLHPERKSSEKRMLLFYILNTKNKSV